VAPPIRARDRRAHRGGPQEDGGTRRHLCDRRNFGRAREPWIGCSPKPREVRQAGIGSGWNLVQLRGFYAYAVAAVSVAPDPAA